MQDLKNFNERKSKNDVIANHELKMSNKGQSLDRIIEKGLN